MNLSYQYYKGYYKEFDWVKDIKSEDHEKYFNSANKKITDVRIATEGESLGSQTFQLYTTYPGLLIGSGYTHGIGSVGEFKIGFQFDYVNGMPVIPGSSVKGVLRSAFPGNEITIDKKEEDKTKDEIINETKAKWLLALIDEIYNLDEIIVDNALTKQALEFLSVYTNPKEISDKETFKKDIAKLKALEEEIFAGVKDIESTKAEKKFHSIYKRDIFHSAYPIKSHNKETELFDTDSITPHGDNPLKNPTPLLFLKVLPQVEYQFNFDLKDTTQGFALSKEQKQLLFQKIILTFGVGAKTNVGYGQFILSQEEIRRYETILEMEVQNQSEREAAARIEEINASPEGQRIEKLIAGSPQVCIIIDNIGKYYRFNIINDSTFTFQKKKSKTKIKKVVHDELPIGTKLEIILEESYKTSKSISNFRILKILED